MKTSGFTDQTDRAQTIYRCLMWGSAIVFVILLFGGAIGPMPGGLRSAPGSAHVLAAHGIGLALYSYANDNDQMYPGGSSSTEAFQKLIDGGYVTDPTIFYIPMPGKVPPQPGQKLKPENVSWDLTASVDATSRSDLPLLFMTGYKVNYVPGGSAVPLHGIPQYGHRAGQTTWERWLGLSPRILYEPSTGIAIFYVHNESTFAVPGPVPSADGSIPHVVPSDLESDVKTYHQLTPDGILR